MITSEVRIENQTAALMCNSDSTIDINFAWKKNEKIIANITGEILILNSVKANDTRFYECITRNKYGSMISKKVHLMVSCKCHL